MCHKRLVVYLRLRLAVLCNCSWLTTYWHMCKCCDTYLPRAVWKQLPTCSSCMDTWRLILVCDVGVMVMMMNIKLTHLSKIKWNKKQSGNDAGVCFFTFQEISCTNNSCRLHSIDGQLMLQQQQLQSEEDSKWLINKEKTMVHYTIQNTELFPQ